MHFHCSPLVYHMRHFRTNEPQISNQWVHKNAHAVVGTGMYLPALVLSMPATFLARRFGFLFPQMGFYCILFRPARSTQRNSSDNQTVIKGIDLGTRIVKCRVRAKRSSRESTWAPQSSSGSPKDARGIQNTAKGYQKRAKRVTKVDQNI